MSLVTSPTHPPEQARVSEPVADQVARAAVLRRLELEVVRRLDGRVSGEHHTTAIGPGSERAGAREYTPGDDARRIDWSLTARSHAAHVRTTEADRELETWVVADRSASLDFGTAAREKRDVVLGVCAAFGVLTVREGNRYGVLVSGGPELVRRPPAAGRRAMLAALATVHDVAREGGAPGPGADLADALRMLPRLSPRRGQVVVVSDFLDAPTAPGAPRTAWPEALRALATRQQVIAVHVSDPREAELPDVGMLSVVDPETGRLLHVQTRSKGLRERYAAAAAERLARVERDVQRSGAEYLHVSTGRDWLADVVAFAAGRRARHRADALGRVLS